MSGGKQSPRDKMIGMMYLVLTALLALQVSNAVLEKFIFIDSTLERMALDYEESNHKTVRNIQASVEKRNNLPNEVAVLDLAKIVQERSDAAIEELRQLKTEMVQITGGIDPETGQLIGGKDYDKVSNLMLQQGKGKVLQAMLNEYAQFLVDKTGKSHAGEFPPIARDAKDYETFAKDPNQKDKRFAELFFENTPTAAGMASVSYLETEVLNYERKALEILADSVGAADVAFTDIFPLIRPESKIVAAGAKYSAQMFIAASSSALKPTMFRDGKELALDKLIVGDGIEITYGKVEFQASPGSYDKETGLAKKTFKAEIKLNDKSYDQVVEYFVVKPVIQISSRAASALWRNCGNELSIDVPALGTSYAPKITANDAQVVLGSGKGIVTIVPSSRKKVNITVRSSGALIGSVPFEVKDIPLPTYVLKAGRNPVDMANGVKAKGFRALTVTAVAEPNFASDVPKDANYRVREIEVKLVRNGDPVKTQTFKNPKMNLSSFAQTARKGDLYIVTIKRVSRTTFLKKPETIPARGLIYKILVSSN